MSHPSKRKGYDLEVKVRDILQGVFPGIERTGSVNYTKDAPDLERLDSPGEYRTFGPVLIVATQDKRGDILVTTDIHTFVDLAGIDPAVDVYVQCKKREKTWLGTVWTGLKKAVLG